MNLSPTQRSWLEDRPVPALLAGYRADWTPRGSFQPLARPSAASASPAVNPPRRGSGRGARGIGRIAAGQVYGAGAGTWTVVGYDVRIGRWEVVGTGGRKAFMTAKELRTA